MNLADLLNDARATPTLGGAMLYSLTKPDGSLYDDDEITLKITPLGALVVGREYETAMWNWSSCKWEQQEQA